MGGIGPIGLPGPQGAQGSVPSGTIIIVQRGDPVPLGYTLMGTFSQQIDEPNGTKAKVTLDLYKKN